MTVVEARQFLDSGNTMVMTHTIQGREEIHSVREYKREG